MKDGGCGVVRCGVVWRRVVMTDERRPGGGVNDDGIGWPDAMLSESHNRVVRGTRNLAPIPALISAGNVHNFFIILDTHPYCGRRRHPV